MPSSSNVEQRFTSDVACRLRASREKMGLNQSDFAELGGIKRSSQILYENVDRYPDTLYFEKLQQNQVEIDVILTGTARSRDRLEFTPDVLQRAFMIAAGIHDAADPRVVEFQILATAASGRDSPEAVDQAQETLRRFRRICP